MKIIFIIVLLLSIIVISGCSTNQQAATYSVKSIYDDRSLIGKTVSVTGVVSGHFEGESASGIYGESLVIKEGEYELFLKINNKTISYGTPVRGDITKATYTNNILNEIIIGKGRSYRFDGVLVIDQYNPGRVYLDIKKAEFADTQQSTEFPSKISVSKEECIVLKENFDKTGFIGSSYPTDCDDWNRKPIWGAAKLVNINSDGFFIFQNNGKQEKLFSIGVPVNLEVGQLYKIDLAGLCPTIYSSQSSGKFTGYIAPIKCNSTS